MGVAAQARGQSIRRERRHYLVHDLWDRVPGSSLAVLQDSEVIALTLSANRISFTNAFTSPLRGQHGAAKSERWAAPL
jgi:alkylhydroperoxidase family enzyme